MENPFERPTFTDLRNRFEELINHHTPYIDFDIDESNDHYNVASFISIQSDNEELCNEESAQWSTLSESTKDEDAKKDFSVSELDMVKDAKNDSQILLETLRKIGPEDGAFEMESTVNLDTAHKYENMKEVFERSTVLKK